MSFIPNSYLDLSDNTLFPGHGFSDYSSLDQTVDCPKVLDWRVNPAIDTANTEGDADLKLMATYSGWDPESIRDH